MDVSVEMRANADAPAVLSDIELLCQFEGLGRYCEFGFVQRLVGAEPMGLLRFAGVSLLGLVSGLQTRFAGISEPDNVSLYLEDGEYIIKVRNFSISCHTEIHAGDMVPEQLLGIERRKLRVLARQLTMALEQASRIFVFHQREALAESDLARLLDALALYGTPMLLRVVEADRAHSPGTVEMVRDGLLVGYVHHLTPPEATHEPHLESWVDVCRNAHSIYSASRTGAGPACARSRAVPVSEASPSIDIIFGIGGNSMPYMGSGWSDPEPGYIWGIGTCSRLFISTPPGSGDLLLKLIVWPFICAPALHAQRLVLSVNHVEIATYRLVAESSLVGVVPAAVIDGAKTVEIELCHPDAARPVAMIPATPDDRELAVAVRRISIYRSH